MDSRQKLEYGEIYNTTKGEGELSIGTIIDYDTQKDYYQDPKVPRDYRSKFNPVRVILCRNDTEIYACKFRYYIPNTHNSYLQVWYSEDSYEQILLSGQEKEYADWLLKKHGL